MSSKADFNLVRLNNQSNMYGGANLADESNNEDYYRKKARKYHLKCQYKLKQLQKEGKPIPAGYDHYLQPFDSSIQTDA